MTFFRLFTASLLLAGLKTLSMSALNELLEDIELTIQEYNSTLVQELALREELDFDKVKPSNC